MISVTAQITYTIYMDLHRTSAKPEWETIAPTKRTAIQKLAATTHGVITPPNIITVIGLGLVVYGLIEIMQQHLWFGIIWVIIGRLLDIADGMAAQATHTKSPLGEIFDATADKAGTFLTIIVFVLAGITPWWAALALALPQLIIAVVILYKKRAGQGVHPTRQGKLSMAALWLAAAGMFLTVALHAPLALIISTALVTAASIALGFYALWQYATGRD